MSRIALFILLILSSCSHNYYVQDKNNPHYYSGGSGFFPINFLGMAREVTNENAGSLDTTQDLSSNNTSVDNEQSAAVGLIATGISLLVNKDYYESPYISGTCLCSSVKDSVIELPCSDISLKLIDSAGKELQKVHTVDGDFVFPALPNKEYSVVVESEKFQVLGILKRPLYLGDKILIHLFPVQNTSLILAK